MIHQRIIETPWMIMTPLYQKSLINLEVQESLPRRRETQRKLIQETFGIHHLQNQKCVRMTLVILVVGTAPQMTLNQADTDIAPPTNCSHRAEYHIDMKIYLMVTKTK